MPHLPHPQVIERECLSVLVVVLRQLGPHARVFVSAVKRVLLRHHGVNQGEFVPSCNNEDLILVRTQISTHLRSAWRAISPSTSSSLTPYEQMLLRESYAVCGLLSDFQELDRSARDSDSSQSDTPIMDLTQTGGVARYAFMR